MGFSSKGKGTISILGQPPDYSGLRGCWIIQLINDSRRNCSSRNREGVRSREIRGLVNQPEAAVSLPRCHFPKAALGLAGGR